MKDFEDILRLARRRSGEQVALATIVRTHGSSYRSIGTRMLVAADGSSAGALSAGCLEDDIRQRGRAVIDSGRPTLVPYDTRKLFGCDGRIDVFIERLASDGECLRFLMHCFDARTRGVLLTIFAGAEQQDLRSVPLLVTDGGWEGASVDLRKALANETAAARESGRSTVVEIDGVAALLHVIDPPVHLVVAGGAYDAAPLAHLARSLGWRVTVFARPEDDRAAFAGAEVLPVTAPDEWPIAADSRTAALIMTHHFGRDAAFLRQMLRSPFGYIGLLGPRRRRERLLEAITTELQDLPSAKVHNPAGLDIGAETPEEIALAITSEIQAHMTNSAAGFLSKRRGPIHRRNSRIADDAPANLAAV